MIYSIGYEKITLQDLKRVIKQYRIGLVIDVRSIPYARLAKQEFNRNRLFEYFGPRYEWKGDILGGKTGPALEAGIEYLARKNGQKSNILLCVENDPKRCHRFYDISIRLLEKGIEVIHIYDSQAVSTTELRKEAL